MLMSLLAADPNLTPDQLTPEMLEAAMSKAPLQEANVEELCENNHDDIEDPQ